jgi:hypothetical protein
MNLRQRYKKAKQKIELLENQTVKPMYISATEKPIRTVQTVVRVQPYEMEHPEVVLEEVANNLMAEAFKCAKMEGSLEIGSGKYVIRATMRVIDER